MLIKLYPMASLDFLNDKRKKSLEKNLVELFLHSPKFLTLGLPFRPWYNTSTASHVLLQQGLLQDKKRWYNQRYVKWRLNYVIKVYQNYVMVDEESITLGKSHLSTLF